MAIEVVAVNNNIAMALVRPDRIGRMAAHKGEIPLRYREHVCRLARRAILEIQGREHISQEAIGDRWGLSQATINSLKNGTATKIGLRVLIQLRVALGVSLDELLGLPPIDGDSVPPSAQLRSGPRNH
jgi:DNA-binding Xre family transcriptional regulator